MVLKIFETEKNMIIFLSRPYEAYAEGVLPREIFFEKKQILTDKIEELQKRYALVSKIDAKAEAMQKEINSVHGAIDKEGSFDKLTRQMAEIFVEQVTIYRLLVLEDYFPEMKLERNTQTGDVLINFHNKTLNDFLFAWGVIRGKREKGLISEEEYLNWKYR